MNKILSILLLALLPLAIREARDQQDNDGLAFLPIALAIAALSLGVSARLITRFGAKNTLDKNYLYLAEKRGAQVNPPTPSRLQKRPSGRRAWPSGARTARASGSSFRNLWTAKPSASARCATGDAVSFWPRPAGRSGCVSTARMS